VNTTAIGMLLVATVLSTNAFLIFNNAQSRMEELNKQFNEIMTGTIGFLDHAWDVAKNFQNPNYTYDPSELGNYTPSELGNYTTTEILSATNSG
jgi:hypothetical protein